MRHQGLKQVADRVHSAKHYHESEPSGLPTHLLSSSWVTRVLHATAATRSSTPSRTNAGSQHPLACGGHQLTSGWLRWRGT